MGAASQMATTRIFAGFQVSKAVLLIGAAMGAIAPAAVAHAQAVGEPGADQGEEIIVTARKRNETAMDVPATIVALGAAQLERYNTKDLLSLQNQVPGLMIADFGSNSGGSLSLRGMSSSPNNPAVDQTVAINVDGVQVGAGAIMRLGQFDLQQVEVLKGPQALFFGPKSNRPLLQIKPRNLRESLGRCKGFILGIARCQSCRTQTSSIFF